MKHLPLKLGIGVVVVFGLLLAGLLLWKPLKVRWYISKYRSNEVKICSDGILGLLSCGRKGNKRLHELLRKDLKFADDRRKVLLASTTFSLGKIGEKLLAENLSLGQEEAGFLKKYWNKHDEKIQDIAAGRYPLHIACEKGYSTAVRLLIAKGAKVSVKDVNSWRPLHLAALGGYNEICAALIEKGAQVNVKDDSGWTPLRFATRHDHAKTCAFLIEKGAQVNVNDDFGQSLLKVTAEYGHIETCILLIEKGAEVCVKDDDGWIPLHWAARYGHTRAARLLIQKGSIMNIENKCGRTPLDLAILNSHKETANLIRTHGGKTGEELREEGK